MTESERRSSADLVAGLRDGEPAAWREFLDRYGRLVKYLGRKLRLDPDEREDLLQATSLQVLRKLGDLRDPGRLGAWVYTIAWNEGRQILRRRRPTEPLPEPASGRELPEPAGGAPSAHEILEAVAEQESLHRALGEIDDRCRRLLEALYFRDPRPEYRELAREFGIAVGSIGPIRGRCMERLGARFRNVSTADAGSSDREDSESGPG